MIKLFIDPGHGGTDSGASGFGLLEKKLTLDISKRIRKYLNNNYTGHSIKMSRTTDKYLSLTQRTNMANKFKADLFLSIHINAGKGTGFESYVFNGTINNKTLTNQSTIHDGILSILSSYKLNDRGQKKANFAVLRQTSMPALLTENLFIDTKEDAEKLKSSKFKDELAKGHAIGIAKSMGLKKKSKSPTPAKKTKPPKKTSEYTGSSIVDYLKHVGVSSSKENRKKLATEYGVKGYDFSSKKNLELLAVMQKGKPVTTKPPKKKPSYIGKRVESNYVGKLRFYSKASWEDKDVAGKMGKGYGFPNVVDKVEVGNGHQYKVKNSKGQIFYITASNKYVKIV